VNANIIQGDCIEVMRTLDAGSVQTCVTSPPYWGLRDYGVDGQIGLESTPDAYIARMVEVFREVRRVLRDDGTLWLNLGDSYNAGTSSKRKKPKTNVDVGGWNDAEIDGGARINDPTVKTKDLCMMPWRVALALQADGWYIRSVIVWAKKSPMPESVTDRPTSSWEPIFLMAKSERYFYDAEAVKEPWTSGRNDMRSKGVRTGLAYLGGAFNNSIKDGNEGDGMRADGGPSLGGRNQRNVWHLGPEPYAEAHFATFPTEIPRRCILAGSRPGDTVLDPFNGSGTTGAVAVQHGRNYVGIELNPAYIELAKDRIGKARNPATYQSQKVVDAPLFGVAP
jgi:DNA modification methylase